MLLHAQSHGLKGACVYYDGQFNDSRMCVSIAMTAAAHGAALSNYVSVVRLLRDEASGTMTGARLKDTLTGYEWDVRAKYFVNATGPFVDTVRAMAVRPALRLFTSAGLNS